MNAEETRLLHGLYYHREIVGEELPYSASEINWLVHTPIPRGKEWRDENGKLRSIETESDNHLASIGAASTAAGKPLAYLQASGYFTYKKDANYFRIPVTGPGADLARELDTRLGQFNLICRRHKDGIIWFLATVLVSLVTALVTKSGT